MLIQVGYELSFYCPQETPMILMVNVHYSRASDIVIPDILTTDPETPNRRRIATASETGAPGLWRPRGGFV